MASQHTTGWAVPFSVAPQSDPLAPLPHGCPGRQTAGVKLDLCAAPLDRSCTEPWEANGRKVPVLQLPTGIMEDQQPNFFMCQTQQSPSEQKMEPR